MWFSDFSYSFCIFFLDFPILSHVFLKIFLQQIHVFQAFWFAEAQPGALAFRVARLLCAEEMLQKAGVAWGL